MADGVLRGIRVADFSRVLAGPYATMMLADFGADVVKIEPPSGDDTRHWAPPVDATGQATYFGSVNRNKRSVAIDLTDVAARAEAHRIAASADVVIENFRPGVMARFGLSFEEVREANPGVVYCSITGFGTGEGAALAGYDLLVQAVGGLMSITGAPDGDPAKAGVALVDVLTGQNAFAGILLALRERDRTGVGQLIQVNLLQSLLSALTNQAASTLATGTAPPRLGNAHPSIAPYAVFHAADRELVIAVGNDKQFRALAGVLEAPDLETRPPSSGAPRSAGAGPSSSGAPRSAGFDDPRFATNADRVAHRPELTELIEQRLAGASADHWIAALATAGVPAGLVNDVGEAIAFAEGLGLDPVAEIARGVPAGDTHTSRTVANPIGLTANPAVYRTAPPALDEHAGAVWLETSAPRKEPR
ncbi:CaiB/BaiF CoA transferase family protein [Agromyces humatus]|uniref:CoA transferase n=1 Tax=Agromyces humatus TaxID=279573 RepID=A0ABP4X2E4_9MICO|nr:CoA transferase [Agromyces humatus]